MTRLCAGRGRLVSSGTGAVARASRSCGANKPEAAERSTTQLVAVVEALKTYPHLGRAGAEPGVRELVIGGTPYIVLYRVRGKRVTINTIWHEVQRKKR
jgi:toxin ParE1/3/4